MAHHKSALKRIRQSEVKKVHNRYFARSTRSAVKTLRDTSEKETATELLPKVNSMLDKLAKKNIIHDNKASNLKSSLKKHVNSL
jgi:small subunit ribosomal protein S20